MDKLEKFEKLNKAKSQQITKLEKEIDYLTDENNELKQEINEFKKSINTRNMKIAELKAKLDESHTLTKIILETKPFIKVIHNEDY